MAAQIGEVEWVQQQISTYGIFRRSNQQPQLRNQSPQCSNHPVDAETKKATSAPCTLCLTSAFETSRTFGQVFSASTVRVGAGRALGV